MRNITPNIDKKTRTIPPVAVLNAGLRKYAMSSMGSVTRFSHSTKTVSTTALTANDANVDVLDHPLSGASMRPYTSDEIPTIDRPAPTRSSLASSGSFDLGTRNTPRTRAVRMIGTLTRKTDPYQKWPSSQPLAAGPMAPAAPVTPAQMAMAFARSSGPKTLTRMDSVEGMMNAA